MTDEQALTLASSLMKGKQAKALHSAPEPTVLSLFVHHGSTLPQPIMNRLSERVLFLQDSWKYGSLRDALAIFGVLWSQRQADPNMAIHFSERLRNEADALDVESAVKISSTLRMYKIWAVKFSPWKFINELLEQGGGGMHLVRLLKYASRSNQVSFEEVLFPAATVPCLALTLRSTQPLAVYNGDSVQKRSNSFTMCFITIDQTCDFTLLSPFPYTFIFFFKKDENV